MISHDTQLIQLANEDLGFINEIAERTGMILKQSYCPIRDEQTWVLIKPERLARSG